MVLELTALSRGWPRLGLAILAVAWWTGCGLSFWGTRGRQVEAAKPEATATATETPTKPAAIKPETPPAPASAERSARADKPVEVSQPAARVERPEESESAATAFENADRLDYYFSKLALTERGVAGAITRAGHWGDSVIGGDGLTETIRRKLQERFGDAGHGFHIVGKYNRWYSHRGMRFEEVRPWDNCLVIYKCQKETMRYGYGGTTSTARGKSLSRFQTAAKGASPVFGEKVSRFELWYQKRPDGGAIEIRVDGAASKVVDTRAAAISDEVETVRVPDGEHSFEVAATGSGVARAYGVVMERDVPGVVWDELSLIGSFTQRMDYQDAEHFAGQIKRRDLDLMVFILGGNDLSREKTDLKRTTEPYEREYERVIRKFRAGKPEASCVIMSVTDHAERVGEAIVSRKIVGRLAAAQRRVAQQEGCAFYDTFGLMGGDGTVARWRKTNPPLAAPDLRHATLAGQRHIGDSFYQALMNAYAKYRRRHPGDVTPVLPVALRR